MYTDPGTGAFLLQAILGFIFAAAFYFRQYLVEPTKALWRKLFIGKKDENQKQP